jgi:hypothetical protein
MVGFIAVLEQTPQLQQFWRANSKKNLILTEKLNI